eukprot:g89.t1
MEREKKKIRNDVCSPEIDGDEGDDDDPEWSKDNASPPPPPPLGRRRRDENDNNQTSRGGAGIIALGALAVAGLTVFLISRYRTCQPNEVLVVYGATGSVGPRIVHGGGTFVLPVIQGYRYLSLEPFAIEIPLKGALSSEKVRVNIPSNFTLGISTDADKMHRAATRLLDMDDEQVKEQSKEIIVGQLRSVIASMNIEEINGDRESFEQKIRDHCGSELHKLGLHLINVNITNIEDDSGVIEAMGRKATAEAVQKAVVDVAKHERAGAIGKENEERDKAIGVAEATRDREIGTKTAAREAAIRTAALEAERVAGENKAKESIAKSDAALQIAKASAFQEGSTKEKQAIAAVEEAESRAKALAAIAEAERVEQETRAHHEAPARAMKAKMIVDAEASASEVRIAADAEAEAAFAKYRAEARGEYERLARKAEGLGMIVQNCGGPEEAYKLLMLEQLQPLARESAKAISNIKFDRVVVWDSGSGGGSNGDSSSATANFVRNLTGAMPPAFDVLKNVGGVEGLEKFMPNDFADAVKKSSSNAGDATPAIGYDQWLKDGLRAIFDVLDDDRDGRITLDQFDELLKSPSLTSSMPNLVEELSNARDTIVEKKCEDDGGLLFTDIEAILGISSTVNK